MTASAEPSAALLDRADAIGFVIRPGDKDPTTLGRTRPCLTLEYPAQPEIPTVQACLRPNGKQVRVKHEGYGGFVVPAEVTETEQAMSVSFSAAAAMIKPGEVTGEVQLTRPNEVFTQSSLGEVGGTFAVAPITSCDGSAGGLVRDLGTDEKVVAISFDDGPGAYTAGVLDALAEHGVRATFYMVGSMFNGADDERVQRVVDEGHELANHSYSHGNMAAMSGAGQTEELVRGNELISPIFGLSPCTFRAPYGATSDSVISSAAAQGMVTVGWNVDPQDWTDISAEAIANNALAQVRPGSIILLHDGGEQAPTVEATGIILAELRKQGYRIVTVAEGLDLNVQRSTAAG